MAGNELKIIIGADGKPLQKTLKEINGDLVRLNNQVKNVGTTNPFSGIKPGANEAAFAMTNLGRVAQDLPFGFVGIQNNLNPLLESFQRAKVAAGSTGGALKAMAGSLMGAGGIGFALSVASAAVLLFQNGMMGMGKRTKEAADKTKEFIDSMREVGDASREAAAGVSGEVATIQTLAAAVLDTNKSYEARKNALDQLKSTNKAYFGDLQLEEASLATLTGRVQEYTQALIQSAIVKEYSGEIAKTTKELTNQEQTLDSLKTRYQQADQALQDYQATNNVGAQAARAGAGSALLVANQYSTLVGASASARKAFEEQRDIVETIATQLANYNGALTTAVGKQLELKSTVSEATGKTKKQTDALKEQIATLKTLSSEVGLLKSEESLLMELQIQLAVRDFKKEGLSLDQLTRRVENIIKEGTQNMKAFDVEIAVNPVLKQGMDVSGTLGGTISPDFNQSGIKAINESADNARKRFLGLQGDIEQTSRAVGQFLTPVFSQFFDSLLSGSQSAFQAITQFLKNLVSQLISTIATAAALAVIFQALGLGGGASFGALFKGFMGFKPMAAGGITTGPTFALIGEAGQEAVIPLNKLPELMNAGGGGSGVEFIESQIRGNDIYQIFRVFNKRNDMGFI